MKRTKKIWRSPRESLTCANCSLYVCWDRFNGAEKTMAQLDAFTFANTIRDRLVDFSLDRNFVRLPELTEICRKLWAGRAEYGGLVSDLWVEGAFPAETSAE